MVKESKNTLQNIFNFQNTKSRWVEALDNLIHMMGHIMHAVHVW